MQSVASCVLRLQCFRKSNQPQHFVVAGFTFDSGFFSLSPVVFVCACVRIRNRGLFVHFPS